MTEDDLSIDKEEAEDLNKGLKSLLDSSKGTPERETYTRANRNTKFQEMYNKIFESNANTFKTTFLQANKPALAAVPQKKINFFSPGTNAEYNHTSITSKRTTLFSPEMNFPHQQKTKSGTIMVDTKENVSKKRERLHNEMVKLKDSFFIKSSRAGNASEASSKFGGIFSCNKSFLKKTTSSGCSVTSRVQSSVFYIT